MSGTYHDPGFAVASMADKIIDERRSQVRQAMLDELNKRNVESQISDRDENAKANAEARAALAEDRRAQAGQRFLGNFHMGQDVNPEDVRKAGSLGVGSSFDPGVSGESGAQGLSSLGISGAPLAPGQNPETAPVMGAGDIVSTTPQTRSPKFLGSPKEQESEERRQRIMDMMNTPGWKDADDLTKAVMYNEASGAGPLPAGAFKTDKPTNKPIYILHKNNTITLNGKVIDASSVPANAQVLKEIQEGGGGSSNTGTYTTYEEIDPKTGQKTGKILGINNKTMEGRFAVLPKDAGTLGPKPGANIHSPDARVSDTTYTEYINAKMAVDKDPKNAEMVQAKNALGQRIIQEFKADPEVKEQIRQLYANPRSAGLSADVLLKANQGSGASAQEIEDFRALWGILTGSFNAGQPQQ
jgi:hypothetical protein